MFLKRTAAIEKIKGGSYDCRESYLLKNDKFISIMQKKDFEPVQNNTIERFWAERTLQAFSELLKNQRSNETSKRFDVQSDTGNCIQICAVCFSTLKYFLNCN